MSPFSKCEKLSLIMSDKKYNRNKKCRRCKLATHEIGLLPIWGDFVNAVINKYEVENLKVHICIKCGHILQFYDGNKFLGMGRGEHKFDKNGKAHIEWTKLTK
jgi:hypothetical protein